MDEGQKAATVGKDHMSAMVGTISQTGASDMPYKVVLTHEGAARTEHLFATIRECETFIRAHTPVPPVRSALFDTLAEQI